MSVGACKCFAYHSVKLVLLADGNRYEVGSNTFFKVVKPHLHLTLITMPKYDLSDTPSYL